MTKVAVVAVHGVADQTPASSARSIADLLCADSQNYTEFTEVPLRIARAPMDAGNKAALGGDLGLEYMHGQLAGYRRAGAGAVYETLRLEGKHKTNGDDVHVHEVYWADLSRIGESAYRLFAELYQLLLHLPSLGRNAVENACRANGGHPVWRIASWITARAVALFTVAVPLLNVVLLSLVLVALSAEVPPGAQAIVGAAVPALVMLLGGALVLSRKRLPKPLFYGIPIVIVVGGVIAAAQLQGQPFLYRLVGVEAAVAAIGVCAYLASKYNIMKPGAVWFGIVTSGAASVTAVYFLLFKHPSTEAGVYAAALNTAEMVVWVVGRIWALFAVLLLASAIVTWIAARTASDERRLALRAAWTGRFGIAFPAALFATITLPIWFLITKGVGSLMPEEVTYVPILFRVAGPDPPFLDEFMFEMLKRQAEYIPVTTAALVLFILAALWAAGPSVAQEVAPPKKHDSADGVGFWLSRGIPLVAVAGNLLTLSFAFLIVLTFRDEFDLTPVIAPVLSTIGAAVGAVLAMKNLTKSLRAAVDILLDVDNYMRESPGDATPRARIAERFVSLLRHLIGSGYERIVIVAHSQGTVIAADVLRYLKEVHPEEIPEHVEIKLFTMGSPLRQMYAAAFPYLYSWIDTPAGSLAPVAPALIGGDAPPPPVGVKVWSNAYRSGDYVGRHLWLDETYAGLWMRDEQLTHACDTDKTRVQFCIGAGAHTHYWNAHGADVAKHLSELIS